MRRTLTAWLTVALLTGCVAYPRVPDGERANVIVVLCVLAYCPIPPTQKAKKDSTPTTENSHE